MAKKRIHSVAFDEVRVREVAGKVQLTFMKRVRGGRVPVAQCAGTKQDKQTFIDSVQAVMDDLEG